MSCRLILLLSVLTIVLPLFAQVPNTHLYLFALDQDGEGQYHLYAPRFLSGFNPDGYTNQPAFITEEEVFVSVRLPESDQNDIYALDLGKLTIRQVTNTPESEYSPKRVPGGDWFSCVVQTPGESVDQRIRLYALDDSNRSEPAFSEIRNVGYYHWINDRNVAMFLVDETPKLAIGDREKGTYILQTSNIGRGFDLLRPGKLVYIHKYTDRYWYVKALDNAGKRSEIIVETPDRSEDFCIAHDGTLLMASGATLYQYHPDRDSTWNTVADLSIFGLHKVTRLAINATNQLICVDQRE